MRILIDADACPRPIKEILYKAAIRTGTNLILVANQYMNIPNSPLIKIIQVPSGFDEADKRIVEELHIGDIVITGDIILADLVIEKGGIALNPRGTLYTKDNIKSQLATRNLREHLRDSLLISGGTLPFNKQHCQALANQLDRLLTGKAGLK